MLNLETRDDKKRVAFVLAGIFLLHFLYDCLTPLIFDDFHFVFSYIDGSKITTLKQIFENVQHKYMTWSGRVVACFFECFCLFIPRILYNILAATSYTLLIYFITKTFCKRLMPDLVWVTVLIWWTVVCWGDCFLWIAGACNYLLTTVFVFGLLVLYEKNPQFKNVFVHIIASIAIFVLGLIAGCSNENTAVALVAMVVAYWVYNRYFRKEKMQAWFYVGFVGVVIGAAVLILAPGNYARADVFEPNKIEQMNFIFKYLYRFVLVTGFFIGLNAPILILTFITMRKRKVNKAIFYKTPLLVYLVGLFVTTYSLVMPPVVSTRSFMIVNLLSIVIYMILKNNSTVKESCKDVTPVIYKVLIIAAIISAVISTGGNIWYYVQMTNTYAYLEEQKALGNLDVTVPVPKVLIGDIHKCQIRVSAISTDPTYWGNQAMAKAFGLNTITGVK